MYELSQNINLFVKNCKNLVFTFHWSLKLFLASNGEILFFGVCLELGNCKSSGLKSLLLLSSNFRWQNSSKENSSLLYFDVRFSLWQSFLRDLILNLEIELSFWNQFSFSSIILWVKWCHFLTWCKGTSLPLINLSPRNQENFDLGEAPVDAQLKTASSFDIKCWSFLLIHTAVGGTEIEL